MLYFLHISKCAGSSFISLARKNVGLFNPNANGNPLNPLTGERLKFWRWTPPEQQYFLSSALWGLTANENRLHRNFQFFEGVVYVTILREPIDRLFSAYQYSIAKPGKGISLEERGHQFADFLRHEGPGWRRNHLITAMSYGDPRSLNERLEMAKRRLEQFDHIFLMDTLSSDVSVLGRYGWDHLEFPWKNTRAPGESTWSAAREALRGYPGLLKRLAQENEADLEFYGFAKQLAEQRKFVAPMLERQPKPAERVMPQSSDFTFLVSCAYEAYLNGDEACCAEILDRMSAMPEAGDLPRGKTRSFVDFALLRFSEPKRVRRVHRRRTRARKNQAAEAA